MSLLLVTGTSGAGASTCAAAAALACADQGYRAVLVSLAGPDGGAELGDVLGPEPVESSLRFVPRPASSAEALTRGWFGEDLIWPRRTVRQMGLHPVAAEVLGPVPLLDDLAGLFEVRRWLQQDDAQVVVVDVGDLGRLGALIQGVEQVGRLVGELLDVGTRVARAVNLEDDPLVPAADTIVRIAAQVGEDLRRAQIHVVADSEAATVARLQRGLDRLRLYGLDPDPLLIRRPRRSENAARHLGDSSPSAGHNDDVTDDGASRSILWAWEPIAPIGVDQLRRLVQRHPELAQLHDPAQPDTGSQPRPFRVERDPRQKRLKGSAGSEVFTLALPLPGMTSDRVAVARRGDDLMVDLDGHRRVVALPSALRRCVMHRARLRDGELRIEFQPDPALWPKA